MTSQFAYRGSEKTFWFLKGTDFRGWGEGEENLKILFVKISLRGQNATKEVARVPACTNPVSVAILQ